MARSRVNSASLRAQIRNPGGDLTQWMLRLGYRIRDGAVIRCNVDSGRLRSSISVTLGEDTTGIPTVRVGTDVEYAYWVHQGRGPVYPVQARALRWVTPNGQIVFARSAGPYAGNPFLVDALEAEIRAL